ncbi:MAG: ABC transporter ATP-binding protein [Halapricum sp.]
MSLLDVSDIVVGYQSDSVVVDGVSLSVEEDSVVALLGRNGVGKTTTLKSVVGLLTPREGTIRFADEDITGCTPHQAADRGISLVLEDRGIFPGLTVRENLDVPHQANPERAWSLEEVYDAFPKLEALEVSDGGDLSGGEQQMLTIARALRTGPRLLLLDEPSEGLAPQIVEDVAEVIDDLAASGITVLLVEQNVNMALDVADDAYIMDAGEIVYEGTTDDVEANMGELESYLGVHD